MKTGEDKGNLRPVSITCGSRPWCSHRRMDDLAPEELNVELLDDPLSGETLKDGKQGLAPCVPGGIIQGAERQKQLKHSPAWERMDLMWWVHPGTERNPEMKEILTHTAVWTNLETH